MLMIVLKSKALLLVPFVCMLCFSGNTFSQNKSGKEFPVAKFANIDLNRNPVATYEQVLANPVFTWSLPGYEMLYFSLSFQPKGKDFIGPFTTKGSKLTDKEIEIIKKLRAEGIENVKVFFEDIKAAGPDKQVRNLGSIIFTIEQH